MPRLRDWALTNSRPSANMTLIILRVADLAAALPNGLFEQPVWNCLSGKDKPELERIYLVIGMFSDRVTISIG
jgi:hypothetical protein